MIIPDTSIWIEFLKNNPAYSPALKNMLEKREILAVECIFGELLQGAKTKRETEIISLYRENLPRCSEENDWIDAGIFSSQHKLFARGIGLIDCAIIIAAHRSNSRIWSLDKKLNSVLKKEERFIL